MIANALARFAVAAIVASAAVIAIGTPAEARKGKEDYVQDYNFEKPMHGYSGHSGNYYCDYQRLPIRKCNAKGQCKIVGWTLRQSCH